MVYDHFLSHLYDILFLFLDSFLICVIHIFMPNDSDIEQAVPGSYSSYRIVGLVGVLEFSSAGQNI